MYHPAQDRHRSIAQHNNHCGKPCEGAKSDTKRCHPDCRHEPVDCALGGWGQWGACTKTCGGGQQTRARAVETESQHNGNPCSGPLTEVRGCNFERGDQRVKN